METTTCPHCRQIAGFNPSSGEVHCPNCGLMEPPDYELQRKPFRTCQSLVPVPTFMGSGKKPWHAPYLEMHLMGINWVMFYHDVFSDRKNKAIQIIHMYKDMGLITYFSMN